VAKLGSKYFHIEELKGLPISELEVEIVERKGKGHPDSIIDGACEAVSRELSKFYLQEYGTILHHNVDKGLLVGGRSSPRFGGGQIVEPIYIIVAGRATSFVNNHGNIEQIPVGKIAISSIKNFIKSSMRFLDPEQHTIIDYKIKQGSQDLMALRELGEKLPLCNDTSIGVGFAPLTPTEQIVLKTEQMLNSKRFKKELPEIGEDVKVMAFRKGKSVELTVAAATISHLIPDKSHYISVVEETKKKVEDLVSRISELNVNVKVNAADNYEKNVFYLTVTGTSAEAGDDGNTGRGNRLSGLITPMRQYSMEAAAGKNPVNHTGKIFNIIAQKASDRIAKEVNEVKEVYVRLLSRIGVPLDQPQVASVALILDKGKSTSNIKSDVQSIVEQELASVKKITDDILSGKIRLF
jgi:S-adenosylmethionine synthetase